MGGAMRMKPRTEAGSGHGITNIIQADDKEVLLDDVHAPQSPYLTGNMDISTTGATTSFAAGSLATEKTIVIVRHGMSTWNEEGRIQVKDFLSN